ncbi:MAG: hypothetical protein V1744_08565 [Candidatus Altiarchaeota archaeon]
MDPLDGVDLKSVGLDEVDKLCGLAVNSKNTMHSRPALSGLFLIAKDSNKPELALKAVAAIIRVQQESSSEYLKKDALSSLYIIVERAPEDVALGTLELMKPLFADSKTGKLVKNNLKRRPLKPSVREELDKILKEFPTESKNPEEGIPAANLPKIKPAAVRGDVKLKKELIDTTFIKHLPVEVQEKMADILIDVKNTPGGRAYAEDFIERIKMDLEGNLLKGFILVGTTQKQKWTDALGPSKTIALRALKARINAPLDELMQHVGGWGILSGLLKRSIKFRDPLKCVEDLSYMSAHLEHLMNNKWDVDIPFVWHAQEKAKKST